MIYDEVTVPWLVRFSKFVSLLRTRNEDQSRFRKSFSNQSVSFRYTRCYGYNKVNLALYTARLYFVNPESVSCFVNRVFLLHKMNGGNCGESTLLDIFYFGAVSPTDIMQRTTATFLGIWGVFDEKPKILHSLSASQVSKYIKLIFSICQYFGLS